VATRSATVDALKGTRAAHYHGIDLCHPGLDLASQALKTLGCPVTLDQSDFVEAFCDWSKPADVAWTGLSLHHLFTPAKLTLMSEIRSIVGDHGFLLIYEKPAQTAKIAVPGFAAGIARSHARVRV
jgi:hypothetical protein